MKKLTLLFFLISTGLYAQKQVGEATIPAVQADGFYKLYLAPEWIPYLNENLSNIRIVDEKNQEVPYIYQQETPVAFTQQFKPYEIIEKKQVKNCCTTLVLHNPADQPINNINLSIKNADVTKYATLLGSDDTKNWYALKEHFILSAINSTNNTSEIKIVDFPLSNYSYYQIQIEDSTSAPLNILSAGFFEVNTANGSYTAIDSQYEQIDSVSEKSSYITLRFNSNQIVDKLALTVEGPPYFLRRASLHQKASRLNKKGETIYNYQKLDDFTISSKQSTLLELSSIRVNELLIIIENDDNPPLLVKQLKTFQLNQYFTAWLKKDESYNVKIGELSMAAPVYDLGFFKESIASTIPVVHAGKLNLAPTAEPTTTPTFFTNRNIIWVAIVVVIIVFGFMAIRMVRETSQGKE